MLSVLRDVVALHVLYYVDQLRWRYCDPLEAKKNGGL